MDESTATVAQRAATRMRGLRAGSVAAIVILLIEYGLGVWVNLYGRLPAADHGAGIGAGFARAVSGGPVGLSVHALLGVILIVSASAAVVRAVLARRAALVAAAVAGLAAIAVAAVSGAAFVGTGSNAASMSMAIAAGVAIGCYAFIVFLSVAAAAGDSHD
jgi:hypothetical protein